MVRFYFNVSYKGSFTGFQQSWISAQGEKLDFIEKDVPISALTRSAMRNGGVRCAAGRSQSGYYFVIRKLQIEDAEGRLWHINMGIEAELEDCKVFGHIVQKILLEHDTFTEALRCWFSPAEGALSYSIEARLFRKFMDSPCCQDAWDAFCKKNNYYVMVLRHFLKDLENGLTHRLNFLVPERSVDYFYKMNSAFENCFVAYNMDEVQFQLLLSKDANLYDVQTPIAPWKYVPIPDAERLMKIRRGVGFGIKIVCAAALLDVAFRIANAIIEEERE